MIGSRKRGGMGAAEAVPFKGAEAAKAFAAKFGGRLVAFDKIPRKYILGEAGTAPSYGADGDGHMSHGGHDGHGGQGDTPKTAEGGHKTKTPKKGGMDHGSDKHE